MAVSAKVSARRTPSPLRDVDFVIPDGREGPAAALLDRRPAELTWGGFLARNLVPVTLGNVIGGALLVGGVYWFVYLRPRARS
jgi:formate/nitrite transporter FocA (FNT family)